MTYMGVMDCPLEIMTYRCDLSLFELGLEFFSPVLMEFGHFTCAWWTFLELTDMYFLTCFVREAWPPLFRVTIPFTYTRCCVVV